MKNKYWLVLIVIVVVLVLGYLGRHKIRALMSGSQDQSTTAPQVTTTSSPDAMTQASSSATTTKNSITIQNFSYSPSSLTVKVGDTVTWTNKDSAGHSATADDKSFDTGVLSNGQSGSLTFNKAGTFSYHCSVHPNMKATIVVQ